MCLTQQNFLLCLNCFACILLAENSPILIFSLVQNFQKMKLQEKSHGRSGENLSL